MFCLNKREAHFLWLALSTVRGPRTLAWQGVPYAASGAELSCCLGKQGVLHRVIEASWQPSWHLARVWLWGTALLQPLKRLCGSP